MRYSAPSPLIALTMMATQLLGPAALWAAEQRGIRIDANRQIVVSALSGNQLTAGTKTLQFREAVDEGATLMTGPATTAELLIGNRAVVMLGNGTTAQVRTVSADQTTIQVTNGMVRVAAAASAIGSQGRITVQTPTSQVQTRGGIVRVLVETPVGKVEHHLTGVQAYRASYSAETIVASANVPSDLIHVEEGTAEIPGVGPSGGLLTIKAGQRVTVQTGRAGTLAEAVSPGAVTTGVLATTSHTLTPKEGRDYLVALQVNQAAQLADTLTKPTKADPKKSEPEGSEKKSNAKDVINGATGGVSLQNNLVSALFGTGSAASPAGSNPTNSTGAGYGGNNNSGFGAASADGVNIKVNGANALLVFTRKDPVQSYVKEDISLEQFQIDFAPPLPVKITSFDPPEVTSYKKDSLCGEICLEHHENSYDSQGRFRNQFDGVYVEHENVVFRRLPSVDSKFTVVKELVLVGGTLNTGHGGIAPFETLIVRGAAPRAGAVGSITNVADSETFLGLDPTDREPAFIGGFSPTPPTIVKANSTFVVETKSTRVLLDPENSEEAFIGGTLGQFSNLSAPSPNGIAIDQLGLGVSHVDGAITATGSNVVLKGGVTLDQESIATIGQTAATKSYFAPLGATFTGSLMSVINGPTGLTKLTMQDRMLGVYDGSIVQPDSSAGGKALLSVLDAKLVGPSGNVPLIDIAAGSHFDRDGKPTPGKAPNVTVTSALVTRSTIPLDGALLEASAPLIALTGIDQDRRATMTTPKHFADLAGNQAQSLNLNGALVALNASKLSITSGHLLNLNNATAAISGYLFSLTNGSGLDIKNGALFSLNNNSSLTLNGNAFGVFGSGSNTVTIENNLCTGPCGRLVNSASQPITTLEGIPLMVSGVTQDVVLPNGFNAFALAPGATAPTAKIDIDANDALFHLDPTSTLTINGTKVK